MSARLGQLCLLIALVATAGFAFAPVYDESSFTWVMILTAVASVGLWVLVRERWPNVPSAAIGISAVAYLFVMANGVTRDAFLVVPTSGTVAEVLDGLVNGWARLLSTSIPVAGDPSVYVLGPTLVWIAGCTAAELSSRWKAPFVPVFPPLCVFGLGVFLSGAQSGASTAAAGIFVALALALALVRHWRPARTLANVGSQGGAVIIDTADLSERRTTEAQARTMKRRQLALGTAVLVSIALLAALLGPELPWASARAPYDPHDVEDEPEVERLDLNPLITLQASLTQRPKQELFTVDPEGSTAATRWRLVVLDEYDGEFWSSTGRYQTSGTELPPRSDPFPRTDRLVQHFALGPLPGRWLPAAEDPVEVNPGDDFQVQVDPDTGVLVANRDLDGLEYTVESAVPRPNDDELQAATLTTGPVMDAFTELPVPTQPESRAKYRSLRRKARALTDDVRSPYAKAKALQDFFLETNFEDDLFAPPGHSYAHLETFVLKDGRQKGSPEHFATAFAVMARMIDLPARVVVGYRSGEQDSSGLYHVDTSFVHAWPEVHFQGLGWVPFEPDPNISAIEGAQIAESRSNVGASGGDDGSRGQGAGGGSSGTQAAEDSGGLPTWVKVLGALVLLVVLLLALLVIATSFVRARRRSGRRRGPPRRQVVGAYQEALDDLSVAGLHGTRHMSAAELASLTEERFGEGAAQWIRPLGGLANHALFGPREVDPDQAARAWDCAIGLHQALHEHSTRGQRLTARVDPRPLVRRR